MKKALISLVLIMSISSTTVSASQSDLSNTSPSNSYEDLQRSKDNNYIIKNDPQDVAKSRIIKDSTVVSPYAENPGVGATRVNLVTYGSYAVLEEQDKQSGIFETIKNNAMWIIGNFVKTTVGTVVYNVVDLLIDNIDVKQYATAKTLVGYSYPTKQGQVWYNNTWNTLFETTNRNTYKYYYALFWNTNHVQRQDTKDFTPDKGFSPERIQKSTNYDNNQYILNKANTNYLQGKKYTSEEWN
ncbi:hypothetical protein HP548_08305 [Paenibacillus taichungensis]|uniref:Uncharacterized protein n=2 Tax=Paenibacillus taichungensis TaxID=484184 RepID=A0ABX2MHN7_9BACL|nr:hypothetical protein [Paenibacillus taichungensis]NUU54084.1 hypothetical protein [Paenibacillus taichungensis]